MPATQPPVGPRAVRERLVGALRLDLVGPWKAARKGHLLSSIGLSPLVAAGCRELAVTERWGHSTPAEIEKAGGSGKTPVLRLTPHEAVLAVSLGGSAGPEVRSVPGSGGLQLHVVEQLRAGTRWVSCFLVNWCTPEEAQPDCAYAFPTEIEARADEGLVPRSDLRGAQAAEWEDRVADPHCIATPEHATGHGAWAERVFEDGGWRTIRAAWIAAEVEKPATWIAPGVALSMEVLGWLNGGAAVGLALSFLVKRYSGWRRRHVESGPLQGARRDTANPLPEHATVADDGMARGVTHLGEDGGGLETIRVASRGVVRTRRYRHADQSGPEGPSRPPVETAFLPPTAPRLAHWEYRHSGRLDRPTLRTGADHRRASGPVAAAVALRPPRPCYATTGYAEIRRVRHHALPARVANGPSARASSGGVPRPKMSGAMLARPSRGGAGFVINRRARARVEVGGSFRLGWGGARYVPTKRYRAATGYHGASDPQRVVRRPSAFRTLTCGDMGCRGRQRPGVRLRLVARERGPDATHSGREELRKELEPDADTGSRKGRGDRAKRPSSTANMVAEFNNSDGLHPPPIGTLHRPNEDIDGTGACGRLFTQGRPSRRPVLRMRCRRSRGGRRWTPGTRWRLEPVRCLANAREAVSSTELGRGREIPQACMETGPHQGRRPRPQVRPALGA